MSRRKGTVPYAGSLEVTASAPLDARRLVELKSDLVLKATWEHSDTNLYIFNGMDVIVFNDTDENNGIYILENYQNYNQESSWRKQSSSTNI
ncbi:MAG: hypothetical protein ACMV0Y_05565, partial [Paludibacter sp.]